MSGQIPRGAGPDGRTEVSQWSPHAFGWTLVSLEELDGDRKTTKAEMSLSSFRKSG